MNKKNLILIMVDQQKTSSLPFYNNDLVKTPNLNKLSYDGTIFTNAYTSCPLCVPSRVSLFTSLYPSVHGSVNNNFLFNKYHRNFLYFLKKEDYFIGLAGKNHCFDKEAIKLFDYLKTCSHYGPDSEKISAEQKKSKQFLKNSKVLKGAWGSIKNPFNENSMCTKWVTDNAIKFIENIKGNFCLWYSIPDPHIPFQVCEPYFSMYPISKIKLPPFKENEFKNKPYAQYIDYKVMRGDLIKDNQIKKIQSIYFGMNTFIDKQIGRFFESLKKNNLYDNSIIIYLSDHGEYLGEHKMIRKSKSAYDCLVKIPLIYKSTKKNQLRYNSELVNIVDIYPTIFKELELDIEDYIQGKSFYHNLFDNNFDSSDFIYGEYGTHNEPYNKNENFKICESPFSDDFDPSLKKGGYGKMRYIRTKKWKLAVYLNDQNELYDLENDPYELENIYDNSKYRNIKNDLIEILINKTMSITQPNKINSPVS